MLESFRHRRDWDWEMVVGSKLIKLFSLMRTSDAEQKEVWKIDFEFARRLFDQSSVNCGQLITRVLGLTSTFHSKTAV